MALSFLVAAKSGLTRPILALIPGRGAAFLAPARGSPTATSFAERRLGEILVFPSLNPRQPLPMRLFATRIWRITWIATLTDPYDDPESNYLDPAVGRGLPRPGCSGF